MVSCTIGLPARECEALCYAQQGMLAMPRPYRVGLLYSRGRFVCIPVRSLLRCWLLWLPRRVWLEARDPFLDLLVGVALLPGTAGPCSSAAAARGAQHAVNHAQNTAVQACCQTPVCRRQSKAG